MRSSWAAEPEVATAGEVDRERLVPGATDVGVVAVVADPGIAGGVVASDLLRGIGRRVVGDDQLEVPERLGEDRIDGRGEVVLAVEHGQADADRRKVPSDWFMSPRAFEGNRTRARSLRPAPTGAGSTRSRTSVRLVEPGAPADGLTGLFAPPAGVGHGAAAAPRESPFGLGPLPRGRSRLERRAGATMRTGGCVR